MKEQRASSSYSVSQIREAMGPELCLWADAIREKFGGRMVYLKTAAVEIGRKLRVEPVRSPSLFEKRGKL